MNITEKLEREIDRVTSERVSKEIDRVFKTANEFLCDRLPDLADQFNTIVDAAIEIIHPRIRAEVEDEFLKRLSEPGWQTTDILTKKLQEFEEAARKIRPRAPMPEHPWPTPPWPIQPYIPNSPYKQPFGPIWCGPEKTQTFTQP